MKNEKALIDRKSDNNNPKKKKKKNNNNNNDNNNNNICGHWDPFPGPKMRVLKERSLVK